MKKQFILILSIFMSIASFSQDDVQSFTLQETIDYALENNRTAKNAARDIEISKQQKWETTAIGLPQINAQVEIGRAHV